MKKRRGRACATGGTLEEADHLSWIKRRKIELPRSNVCKWRSNAWKPDAIIQKGCKRKRKSSDHQWMKEMWSIKWPAAIVRIRSNWSTKTLISMRKNQKSWIYSMLKRRYGAAFEKQHRVFVSGERKNMSASSFVIRLFWSRSHPFVRRRALFRLCIGAGIRAPNTAGCRDKSSMRGYPAD